MPSATFENAIAPTGPLGSKWLTERERLIAKGLLVPSAERQHRLLAAKEPGAPSAGPFNWAGAPVLRFAGRTFAPWDADCVVDPDGYREGAVRRRTRRDA